MKVKLQNAKKIVLCSVNKGASTFLGRGFKSKMIVLLFSK